MMVELAIPSNCYNAGQIEEFGKSHFHGEHETLFPPYTAVKMTNKDNDYIKVDVTRDNKYVSFERTHYGAS